MKHHTFAAIIRVIAMEEDAIKTHVGEGIFMGVNGRLLYPEGIVIGEL